MYYQNRGQLENVVLLGRARINQIGKNDETREHAHPSYEMIKINPFKFYITQRWVVCSHERTLPTVSSAMSFGTWCTR
jgi:hypothetical protein